MMHFARLLSLAVAPSTTAFRTRRLGSSQLVVTEACLGTMTWGVQNTEAEAHEQLDFALKERGVTMVDTAELYPVPLTAPEWQAGRTEEFATYLEGAGLSNMVTCPKVYRQASASRVLTLEYLDGVSLSNLEAVKQYFPEPEVALIASLNTWVGSVLQNDWCAAAQLVSATLGAILRRRARHTTGSTPTSTPATCSRSPTDASPSSTLGSSAASRRRPPRGCSTSCAPSRSATWAASRRR